MDKRDETKWLFLLIAVCIAGTFIGSYIQEATAICTAKNEKALIMLKDGQPADNEYEGIIRFHVIANSNSEKDQELKLLVRDCVMIKLNNRVKDYNNVIKTREYIIKNLETIEEWASDCVKSKGYNYEVKAELGIAAVPAKQYEEMFFPAGNYEALTITIGKGEGRNWWCVVFPPLCLVNCKDSEKPFMEYGENRLVLKSKINEILSKKHRTDL